MLWFVATALAFPLGSGDGWVPPAFIPTAPDLLTAGDWRVFLPHGLYTLYGVLLIVLGSRLLRRAQIERIPGVFGDAGEDARRAG